MAKTQEDKKIKSVKEKTAGSNGKYLVLAVICVCIAIAAQLHFNIKSVSELLSKTGLFGSASKTKLNTDIKQNNIVSQKQPPQNTLEVKKVATQNSLTDGQVIDPKAPKAANREGRPPEVDASKCQDRHAQCLDFADHGECDRNPGWMAVNCPKSCDACHLLDPKVRCNRERLGIPLQHVYHPGDMNAMFESIEKTYSSRYKINVLSRDPWVVTFDNFLSDREIEALIRSVDGNWERSTDTGSVNAFGETGRILSEGRTSNNAWCREACNRDPDVQNIVRKISEVTWVPSANFEAFQVLRYELGQKYNTHHDASESQARLACGIRILTFFLYLSDVEEGGETAFPSLNISVKPRKGSALLWPSTLDADPSKVDGRTMHEARPVIKGVKFAANTWIHSHDFTTSNLHGCTGTFDMLS